MWPTWLPKPRTSPQWAQTLVWYRLRYLTPGGPTRSIRLLSRPQACGRVALYFQPNGAVAQLYLGLPEAHERLLQRMAVDFGFSLTPKPPAVTVPAVPPLSAVAHLPWERAFLAHVVNESLFVSLVEAGSSGDNPAGRRYSLPQPSRRTTTSGWQLPRDPVPGLTLRPSWPGQPPPDHLVATEPDVQRWLLGRSVTGRPLHVAGRVNLYGRQAAVTDWLVHEVTQLVALEPANLVVLDGRGDLVPRLKRKAAVTRLLGTQLAYLDIDSTAMANGFNPLAAVPGETAVGLLQRWQRWFGAMNVAPQGVELLAQAQAAGVGDVPALRKWLKQVERHGQTAAVTSLSLVLNRLTAQRGLREWLEWPVNRFDILPSGALFLACQATSWARQQLLLAALLAALQVPGVRLIAHGLPGKGLPLALLGSQEQLILSNGPLLPEATVVLTASHTLGLAVLQSRFLGGDGRLGENLALLQSGEAVVLVDGAPYFTTWQGVPAGEVTV